MFTSFSIPIHFKAKSRRLERSMCIQVHQFREPKMMELLKMGHRVIQMMCKCLSRGAVLNAFINSCAELLEMLWGGQKCIVREAVRQVLPVLHSSRAEAWWPRPWDMMVLSFRRAPALSSAVPSGELCSCEGWNEARTLQSHCSICVCWLWVSITWDFSCSLSSYFSCSISSLFIKILNQCFDCQFQTRCWQLWELLQVAMG